MSENITDELAADATLLYMLDSKGEYLLLLTAYCLLLVLVLDLNLDENLLKCSYFSGYNNNIKMVKFPLCLSTILQKEKEQQRCNRTYSYLDTRWGE
jgi:hypothetical protein